MAHFHYVLSMGAVFAMFSGFYYWIGKMTGFNYPETLGKAHFWITFLGVNITFFPMHFLGLAGMPRRIPDYPDAFIGYNAIASFGSILSLVGALLFFYIIYATFTSEDRCASNPWVFEPVPNREYEQVIDGYSSESPTLEWLVDSPPAFHTFEELPQIKETPKA